MLLYFIYGFLWFVLVGRRKGQQWTNLFTGLGFSAVMIATGLWALVAGAVFQGTFALERLLLFMSVGLCMTAVVVARLGSRRAILPIVTGALLIALNSIGAVYAR
jgi:hypothetical protein